MNSARDTPKGGLPHSEICGSKIALISPQLIAECHVLHRLSTPRHPPDALNMLDLPCTVAKQGLAAPLRPQRNIQRAPRSANRTGARPLTSHTSGVLDPQPPCQTRRAGHPLRNTRSPDDPARTADQKLASSLCQTTGQTLEGARPTAGRQNRRTRENGLRRALMSASPSWCSRTGPNPRRAPKAACKTKIRR